MTYQTGLKHWQTTKNDFAEWKLTACKLDSTGITLNPALAARQTDHSATESGDSRPFYNGGAYFVGEAESPVTETGFGWIEAIPSWNTSTPPGTWIEVLLRARVGGQWTGWYNLGVWASESSVVPGAGENYAFSHKQESVILTRGHSITRHSVEGQKDDFGNVYTDTLVLKSEGDAFQVKIKLFSATLAELPTVRNFALVYSNKTPEKVENTPPGNPSRWGKTPLNVPECSQMIYPDGGNVWCSAVSVSMVHGFWQKQTGNCEPRVRHAVAGVYDYVYDGHGNWAFNVAYAGELGYDAFIARYTSLADLEAWIEKGIPVIMSVSWNDAKGRPLHNAPQASSGGHLTVLVGFDSGGNPIMNEPAARSNEGVRLTYQRAELEARWLEASGGAVYIIQPQA